VSLLGEDAFRYGGVHTWISEWSRAAGARLRHGEDLHFCIVVGEAEAMEHGGEVEDALTNLIVGIKSGPVHAGHIADSGSRALCRV
jgi:hypothetical protein